MLVPGCFGMYHSVCQSLVRELKFGHGLHIKYLPFGDSLTGEMCQVLNQLSILKKDQSTATVDSSDLDTGVVARKWATCALKSQLYTSLPVFGHMASYPQQECRQTC